MLLPRLQENLVMYRVLCCLYQFLHRQVHLSKNMTWCEISRRFPAQEGHWSLPRAVPRTVTTIPSCVRSYLEVPNAGASPSSAPSLSRKNYHYFCFHILRLCWEKSALLHMALRNLLHQPNACKAKAINKSNIHGSGIQHYFAAVIPAEQNISSHPSS